MLNRALATVVAVLAACAVAGMVGVVPLASAQDCSRPHGSLVAYGHSYMLSPGLGGAKVSYPALAATEMGLKPVIRAVNGGTTRNVDALVHSGPTRWVPGSAGLVVIDSAINDIKLKVPTAQWTASLTHMLSAFAVTPVPTILLLRPLPVASPTHPGHDPKVIAAYAAEQRSVAARFAAVRIVDASSGWSPRLDLSVDGIHPNPAGELHLAKSVRGVASRALCRP